MQDKAKKIGTYGSTHEQGSYVFAVVGMSGSGKSEVVSRLLLQLGGCRVYFGGVVIDAITSRGQAVTEDAEAEVRMGLRKKYGMEALAVIKLPEIKAAIAEQRHVVIDGVYSYAEYRYLKKALGRAFVTVAVHAPLSLRKARLGSRKERPLTEEEIDKRDRREIEQMEKGGPIALADYHLVNDSTISDLHAAIQQKVLEASVLSEELNGD